MQRDIKIPARQVYRRFKSTHLRFIRHSLPTPHSYRFVIPASEPIRRTAEPIGPLTRKALTATVAMDPGTGPG